MDSVNEWISLSMVVTKTRIEIPGDGLTHSCVLRTMSTCQALPSVNSETRTTTCHRSLSVLVCSHSAGDHFAETFSVGRRFLGRRL